MPRAKLTFSADRNLIERAKKLAEREGTSLSSMFSRFLQTLLDVRAAPTQPAGPLTRAATGLAGHPTSKQDRELIEEALADKYNSKR
jgi:hypothetical protein